MKHKSFLLFMLLVVMAACKHSTDSDDSNDVLSKFNSTWNVYEKVTKNSDGTITYNALPWGGLVGTFLEYNMPVDLTPYESITFEFAQPTTVPTQVMVSESLKTWGKPGIMSLTCNFDGQDLKSVEEITLQASDTTVIYLKDVYLTPNNAVWESENIWTGKCVFGNWQEGFIVEAEKFVDTMEGDKIEFVFETDKSSDETYWLFKTIYNGTDKTLEGNESELNQWGCATIGKNATRYRITLTANDVENLSKYGMFVNGFYCIAKQCNILRKSYINKDDDSEAEW
jgi:hypothetical protein